MNEDIRKAYEKTFGIFLLANTPLKEMDEMLKIANIPTVPEEEKNMWQQNNTLGLNYFYLISKAGTERLEDEDADKIRSIVIEPSVEKMKDFIKIIHRTFNEVMCIDNTKKDEATCIGPYADDRFVYDNDSIVIGFSRGLSFDENDSLAETERERRCDVIIEKLKSELLPMINEALNTKICLHIE